MVAAAAAANESITNRNQSIHAGGGAGGAMRMGLREGGSVTGFHYRLRMRAPGKQGYKTQRKRRAGG